mgnify:CR=1 FL=1
MDGKVINLIKYIVFYATKRDMVLTAVRLVKFVYLADLYHSRFNHGETITRFPWAFVNYGPYCSDVMESIDQAVATGLINVRVCDSDSSDGEYRLFSCHDDNHSYIRKEFPLTVISELHHAIRKYGNNTAQLLDYVYFNTEPMRDAKKGDRLDFTLAEEPQLIHPIETGKLSKENIQAARAIVARLKEKHTAARENLLRDELETLRWKDQLYYDTLESLDESLPAGLKGVARVLL